MSRSVDFYFDFGSPASYIAIERLWQLRDRFPALTIQYKPVLLGGIFQATGNQSPVMVPTKARYIQRDLERYAAKYDIVYRLNPFFPINTLQLMRIATAMLNHPRLEDAIRVLFRGIWQQDLNLGDIDVVQTALEKADIDTQEILASIQTPEIKQQLIDSTNAAVERHLFGVPTFFIDDEMYWGQDRLHILEDWLSADNN